jgi:hypothetical protein
MILCGVMARVDTTTSRIRSCIAIGSGLFLEGGRLAGFALGGRARLNKHDYLTDAAVSSHACLFSP